MSLTVHFNPGDILYGRKYSDAVHPIVYLQERDHDFFIGAMLTKSPKWNNNIEMKPEHIRVENGKGEAFEFKYNNTHLVKAKLLKRQEWEPFRKIGELTELGLDFVHSNVDLNEEKLWEDFILSVSK